MKKSPVKNNRLTQLPGFTAQEIVILSQNGALPVTIVDAWKTAKGFPPESRAEDLLAEARLARRRGMIGNIFFVISVLGFVFATFFPAHEESLQIKALWFFLWLGTGSLIWMATFWYIARRFMYEEFQGEGEFGPCFRDLVVTLKMTAGQMAACSRDELVGKAHAELSLLAEALVEVEKIQLEKPDEWANTEMVEMRRRKFGLTYSLMARFGLVDKKLGWKPFFSREDHLETV